MFQLKNYFMMIKRQYTQFSPFSCSVMFDSVTPFTVAGQAPLSKARVLEWVAMLPS